MSNIATDTHRNTIYIEHLSLINGSSILLDDLSVFFSESGVTMILGQNGAGKSLLIRCLHGLIKPSSGLITIGGKPTEDTRHLQALVFQKPILLRRTVAENLRFACQKKPSRTSLMDELRRVHLEDKLDHPARLLSGGEQQRLSLIRALIKRPKYLFLDEPTASLDPASVLIIENIISSIATEGVKVILISHDLGQAKRIGTDILFLHNSKITEYTTARKFFEVPESKEARAYLAGEIVI